MEILPDEILLHICSFLDAKFIISVISRLNRRFYILVTDPTNYKIRLRRRWKSQYPVVEKETDWRKACVYREEENRIWSNLNETLNKVELPTSAGISVDSVLITSDLIIAGSRDRSLTAWNINNNTSTKPMQTICKAHDGWIWSLCASETDKVYSGSWDTKVKLWELTPSASSSLICAGTFDKKVVLFDARSHKRLGTGCYHKKAVLALAISSDYIISASEDNNVIFFDRKTHRRAQTLKFDHYITSLYLYEDALYCGDKAGGIHVVHVKTLKVIQSYPSTHSNQVTGVHCGLGSVVSCSTDGTVKVFQPDLSMENINVIEDTKEQQMTGICYDECRNVLVSGQMGSVHLWRPKVVN
ncbi:F-box/WD repeat-containing protein 9-like [Lepeophtheirus salmonis]|uniref:F-box/WD repeat-containing protein 9-like n=1 Tax=Lepeophtheirus salmonis TaxID=72036 RepID=UPI003AF358E9